MTLPEEDAAPAVEAVTWKKATYSQSSSSNCVELALPSRNRTWVRDSKNPNGGRLEFGRVAFRVFLTRVTGR